MNRGFACTVLAAKPEFFTLNHMDQRKFYMRSNSKEDTTIVRNGHCLNGWYRSQRGNWRLSDGERGKKASLAVEHEGVPWLSMDILQKLCWLACVEQTKMEKAY